MCGVSLIFRPAREKQRQKRTSCYRAAKRRKLASDFNEAAAAHSGYADNAHEGVEDDGAAIPIQVFPSPVARKQGVIYKLEQSLSDLNRQKEMLREEYPDEKILGIYRPDERKVRLELHRAKRKRRNYSKRVIYACRSNIGGKRHRMRGRFIKAPIKIVDERDEVDELPNITGALDVENLKALV